MTTPSMQLAAAQGLEEAQSIAHLLEGKLEQLTHRFPSEEIINLRDHANTIRNSVTELVNRLRGIADQVEDQVEETVKQTVQKTVQPNKQPTQQTPTNETKEPVTDREGVREQEAMDTNG